MSSDTCQCFGRKLVCPTVCFVSTIIYTSHTACARKERGSLFLCDGLAAYEHEQCYFHMHTFPKEANSALLQLIPVRVCHLVHQRAICTRADDGLLLEPPLVDLAILALEDVDVRCRAVR
jgi:hypothetical protein